MLAGVAYISLGLFELPVFHAGGGLTYLLDPGFGYLAGFLPAAWVTGRLARQPGMDHLLNLTGAAIVGLGVLPPGIDDVLAVSGTANLGGTLNVTELSGNVVRGGDTFTVLTAGARGGNFAVVTPPVDVNFSVAPSGSVVTVS